MDENAIEKLLVSDWASGLRLTTVPQAMQRLGIADQVGTRWDAAIAIYDDWQSILASPEKMQSTASAIGLKDFAEVEALSQRWLEQVVAWGRASILLTDNEKLIARYIWARHLQELLLLRPEDIALALKCPAQEVIDGVQMLTRLRFLTSPESPPNSGYVLAEDAARFHDGLGFSFHTVTLDNQETFEIP